ncbi:hypothetical protein [Streptomyces sp. HUAS TT20]|uniref:hypothetical protein n=1 Tax=Streptomyces sp. HUAS TT20 TaxID=3447509 RepID=UPI0021DB070C|nr:hypothetical protein [Streptomyces sp. HUAS 15-9]UXY32108.1 hypothetical protein N8I87_39910 [Streptomyces sp. HUAS 15-9]
MSGTRKSAGVCCGPVLYPTAVRTPGAAQGMADSGPAEPRQSGSTATAFIE